MEPRAEGGVREKLHSVLERDEDALGVHDGLGCKG